MDSWDDICEQLSDAMHDMNPLCMAWHCEVTIEQAGFRTRFHAEEYSVADGETFLTLLLHGFFPCTFTVTVDHEGIKVVAEREDGARLFATAWSKGEIAYDPLCLRTTIFHEAPPPLSARVRRPA